MRVKLVEFVSSRTGAYEYILMIFNESSGRQTGLTAFLYFFSILVSILLHPNLQERQKPSLDVQGTLEELEEELRGCYGVGLTKGKNTTLHV